MQNLFHLFLDGNLWNADESAILEDWLLAGKVFKRKNQIVDTQTGEV